MRIVLSSPSSDDIEITINKDGVGHVHIGGRHVGQARWDKNGDKMRIDLPDGTLGVTESQGLTFRFA